MSNIIETKKLVLSSIDVNSNKVWLYELYDDDSVVCRWGRVGKGMQSKTFSGGKNFAEKKAKEKLKKGYREVAVVGASSTSSSDIVVKNNLKDIATKQIEHSCPTVAKLIGYLTKVNAHNIHTATGGQITYNDTTGLFQTPVGVVSQNSIDEARKILVSLGNCVSKNAFNTAKMREAVEDYLMLVPQEVGRKLTTQGFLPDLSAVQKQNTILDGLETSYASVISNVGKKPVDQDKKTPDAPRIFNVKLDLETDSKVLNYIDKKYNQTRQSQHACNHLNVANVYRVEISDIAKAFENDGAKLSNVWDLWHGTRACNLLSILKGGLKLPNQISSAQITGAMFGSGLYFSDQSTKSLNYAYGYWGSRGRDNNCFMFIASVGMGNYYVPGGPTYNKPPKGHDSYYAKAHKSGVMNNEMIVFRTSQVNLKYLVEFK